ncbi:MAG: hypothetical protein R2824_15745 [Saprospiraceae bacterium]|nr:hypothetical protein [Lewinella sp.]
MKGNSFRYGLYLCLAIFFGSLTILFWPIIQTPKFWLTTGIIVGMVGSLIFGIAHAQNSEDHEG